MIGLAPWGLLTIRILIVSAPDRAQGLAFSLRLLGHDASPSAYDQALVLAALDEVWPSIVLLYDVPEPHLRELVPLLRRRCSADLVVKPKQYSEADLISYLDGGATDYLPIALSPKALAARFRALYERRLPARQRSQIFGDIEVDASAHIVRKCGKQVALTRIEFRLLEELLNGNGRACRRKALLQAVWGREFVDCHHYLRIYVRNLRMKLEDDPQHPQLLHTVRGIGYRLDYSKRAGTRRQQSMRRTTEPAA